MATTAILVDGGFYRYRSHALFGPKSPEERADELVSYCQRHIKKGHGSRHLYRIFYYDCPPSEKVIQHPLTMKNVSLKNTPQYSWVNDFFNCLVKKRKVALRRGEILEGTVGYVIKPLVFKKLLNGKQSISDLQESDFSLDIQQKGVDMRIGLDIASIAYKHQADQIILIAGDSDFVPAAKHARREGIDFILDPMWHTVRPSLYEHIDGLESCVGKPPLNYNDSLCILKAPSGPEISE